MRAILRCEYPLETLPVVYSEALHLAQVRVRGGGSGQHLKKVL